MTESNDEPVAAIFARGIARIRAIESAQRMDCVEPLNRIDAENVLVITADDETRKEDVTP